MERHTYLHVYYVCERLKIDKKSLKAILKRIDAEISQTKRQIQLKDRDAEILTDIQEFAGWVLPKKEKTKKTIQDRLNQGKEIVRLQEGVLPRKKHKDREMELQIYANNS